MFDIALEESTSSPGLKRLLSCALWCIVQLNMHSTYNEALSGRSTEKYSTSLIQISEVRIPQQTLRK